MVIETTPTFPVLTPQSPLLTVSRQAEDPEEVLRRAGFSEAMGVEAALLGRSERGRIYDRFRGRLMFPIRSLSGNVIAFGGRIIADEKLENKEK